MVFPLPGSVTANDRVVVGPTMIWCVLRASRVVVHHRDAVVVRHGVRVRGPTARVGDLRLSKARSALLLRGPGRTGGRGVGLHIPVTVLGHRRLNPPTR